MADWHVLRSIDGRYAAKTWEIFNTTLRRPRASLAAELNNNPIAMVVNLYTSFLDAVDDSVRYNEILGQVTFPVPVNIYGSGPQTMMLERQSP